MKKKLFPKTMFPFVLIFLFPFFAGSEAPVVEDIDYLYLHIGLQVDYPLPESFKKERLKFEGNYKKYTTAVYRKKTNDIRFTPIRRGSSVMIIKNRKNNKIIGRLSIDVQKDNLHKIAAELRDLLVAIDGIEVKIYNKKVIIDGQVLLPREMNRINDVLQKYESPFVRSLVTYSPEAQKNIAELIEKEIGFPEVTVRYAYNRFLLEGCVSSPSEADKAQSIAELYTQFEVSSVDTVARKGLPVIKNKLVVPCESEKKDDEGKKKQSEVKKLIQIVVHFVEMEKSFNKGFLFQWTPAIGQDGTQVTAGTSTVPGGERGLTAQFSATVSNFFPKLNWAKSFNFARVLHNSSILVENEHKDGGTISIQTMVPELTNQGGQIVTTTGVSAGVNLNIKPKIVGDRGNLIKMGIEITVTSPAAGKGATVRTLNTLLHVRDSQSAAVGGLISSILQRGYNSDPSQGVQGSPIIKLYSQKKYVTKKTQFVVFITPLIKSSSHLGVGRIKQKFKLDE